MINYPKILGKHYSKDRIYSIKGQCSYEDIEWLDGAEKPLKEEMDALNEDWDLEDAIILRRGKLETFHNSEETRKLLINSTYIILLSREYRDLVAEQINDIRIGIEDGDIIEIDAIFQYYYNGDDSYIPVTYSQLKNIYRKMMLVVNTNFRKYKEHYSAIDALGSIPLVEGYDYTAGYLLDQNINLV